MAQYSAEIDCPICFEPIKVDSEGATNSHRINDEISGHCENCTADIIIYVEIWVMAWISDD